MESRSDESGGRNEAIGSRGSSRWRGRDQLGVSATAAAQTEKPAQAGAGHTAPKAQPATEAGADGAGRPGGARHGSHPEGREGGRQAARGRHVSGASDDRRTPRPDAKGQTASLERWAEFVKGGKVVGREVVTIIPQAEISKVQKDAPPPSGGAKVETLKGGDYMRVWINRGGNHYLMHFPV